MSLHGAGKSVAGIVLFAALVLAGYATQDTWRAWFIAPPTRGQEDAGHIEAESSEPESVKLTPQAQSNLRLHSAPLKADTFWRTIQVPGMIVDRPAYSDRSIVSPVTGIVTKVHHFPGDTVRPGEPMFTLRLLSEALQSTQTEFFKTSQEIELINERKARLSRLASQGGLSEATLIELDYQTRRLAVADKAYRQELQTRGLTAEQIAGLAAGKFISEIEVMAPPNGGTPRKLLSGLLAEQSASPPDKEAAPSFEVQELKMDLGQQVQAGQTLALLSNHQSLFIEGRAFGQESPLVEKAAKEGWPIHVEFLETSDSDWPRLDREYVIQHIANTIDPASRTFSFFLPLNNQSRSFEKKEKTFMLWRFRPGQKVRLHLKVEKFENVFVLPAGAVVREGPEAFVFRQNGNLFNRKPTRVVHEDRGHVVIANDGSIPAGVYVARSGASQLNRILKTQSGPASGVHVHADGTVHANH